MSEINPTNERIFKTAEHLFLSGVQPTPELLVQSLDISAVEAEAALTSWWKVAAERLALASDSLSIPDVPDNLTQLFSRLWQQAVLEANSSVAEEKRLQSFGIDEIKREADESLQESRSKLFDLEERLRRLQTQIEEKSAQLKGYEAEIEVLKANLVAETSQRKQEEKSKQNVEQELNILRKSFDDSKRTFDQRIKEEQRHTLDAVSKAEADVRYYRGALEKLRDEVGKKESALTKTIHELQAELARKDVKTDTHKTQAKSLEDELKKLKQDSTNRNRDLSQTSAKLLSESNKNKRLEDKAKELEEEIRKLRQKQVAVSNEQSRRESNIRSQYKEKEEELVRALAKVSSLEKKLIAHDEEVRRLNSRL